jgi:hypothetical protein
MTEVEPVNRHMNEQYEEVRTLIEWLKNKEIVENRDNTREEVDPLTSEQKATQVFARLKKHAEKRERREKRGL